MRGSLVKLFSRIMDDKLVISQKFFTLRKMIILPHRIILGPFNQKLQFYLWDYSLDLYTGHTTTTCERQFPRWANQIHLLHPSSCVKCGMKIHANLPKTMKHFTVYIIYIYKVHLDINRMNKLSYKCQPPTKILFLSNYYKK